MFERVKQSKSSPHITDEIKRNVKQRGNTGNFDFVITLNLATTANK
ncbi:MAG: hypothetical protein J6R43_02560 [Paludibacteraceae bacterium]|nr:hypothetical protein [Paludibacteraceae bacterium]